MIKISKLADYATVLMNALLRQSPAHCSTTFLADQTHIALPTVSKVLKLLNEAGLVSSVRGANGGYQLARLPADISIVDIITAIDGTPALTECSDALGACAVDHICGLRGNWQHINRVVVDVLQRFSLADMAQPNEKPLVFYPSARASENTGKPSE